VSEGSWSGRLVTRRDNKVVQETVVQLGEPDESGRANPRMLARRIAEKQSQGMWGWGGRRGKARR
jgi:hypothetical protein